MNQQMENIYGYIHEIASEDIQRRRWLNNDLFEISSFSEIMCRLFDDDHFEDFLRDGNTLKQFSSDTIRKLTELKDMLNNYQEKSSDAEIVDDFKWKEIGSKAGDVLKSWDEDMKSFRGTLIE